MLANFILAWRSFWRKKTVLLLALGMVACLRAMAGMVRATSPAAERELSITLMLSGAFALAMIVSIVLATSLTSVEIAEKRFQLAKTRPAGMWGAMCGKWLAISSLAALALALACAWVYFSVPHESSRRIWRPVAEDPQKLALAGLDEYLANPATPEALKTMSRERALSHLTHRISENKAQIDPGDEATWRFPPELYTPHALRIWVGHGLGLNMTYSGEISINGKSFPFSSTTASAIEVPLEGYLAWDSNPELTFKNTGKNTVFCSIYKDVELLSDGGSFAENIAIAWAVMLSMCAGAGAVALFFGTAFSRNVAIFSVMALLAASLCAPAISDSRGDLAAVRKTSDRMALAVTRTVTRTTAALMAPSPVEDLAKRIRRDDGETLLSVAGILFAVSPAFLALAAAVGRRRSIS